MLYDEWDKLLETRFMKKDELILSGETVTFGSYLVDLGELCQGHQPTSVLNSQNQDKKVSETSNSFYSYSSQSNQFYCLNVLVHLLSYECWFNMKLSKFEKYMYCVLLHAK